MDANDRPHGLTALLEDKVLFMALTVSVGVHITALAIRFVDPEFLKVRAAAPPLEIVLVNAKSEVRPSDAPVMAQNNLDGGGANDAGRRTSPLPNMFEMRDGDSLDAARKVVQQMEDEQKKLLASLRVGIATQPLPSKEVSTDNPQQGAMSEETREQLARTEAEIAREISDYQKRPRKHNFMPSASEYRYARYVEDWRSRVEKVGNENYPAEARGKLYGTLRITVAIRKDGSLVDTIVEQSSGSPVLDRAALRIVKLAAPYPPFAPEIARDTDVLEITRTWIFTNDQLETRSTAAARP